MSARVDPARLSRLPGEQPDERRLLFADLHNHSLHSDGRGDPEDAFHQLRKAGLDVAALTDHASIPADRISSLSLDHYPHDDALAIGRLAPRSIDRAAWKRTAEIADRHDVPGEFTALRGFEWTEPWLGHVNVWFSDDYQPVTTPGRLEGLHDFLAETETSALFGYNHPGREPGRLGGFELPLRRPALTCRMVALEIFNRTSDFLFEGYDRGHRSPLADCLDAGWQPGLIGCSDEHGRSYGLVGKGRTGLWAREHSREGVREALTSRRTYATREVGLRLDATLDGVPMGSALHPGPTATLIVECGSPALSGEEAELQLITSSRARVDDGGIRVVHQARLCLDRVEELIVPVPDDARWLVLRIADPWQERGGPAPSEHPARGRALAYGSPWYLGSLSA